MKKGLVLEGGGVRGIYTAGVLDVFMENGIEFDGVIGVSAGAVHGCSYLSRQKGRSIRYYEKYVNDPRFMGFKSYIKTGDIVGVDFCYHELPDKLDPYDHKSFLENKSEFYSVCTDLESGEARYFKITDMKEQIDMLRASASLPYFSRPVPINGKLYLDGGCSDSIPIRAFREMGFEKNTVVLTQPMGYVKKPELSVLPNIFYKKYPRFAQTLRERHNFYNETLQKLSEMEKEGSVFIIRPREPLGIGRLEKDAKEVRRVYDIGRSDAERLLKDLKKWLDK